MQGGRAVHRESRAAHAAIDNIRRGQHLTQDIDLMILEDVVRERDALEDWIRTNRRDGEFRHMDVQDAIDEGEEGSLKLHEERILLRVMLVAVGGIAKIRDVVMKDIASIYYQPVRYRRLEEGWTTYHGPTLQGRPDSIEESKADPEEVPGGVRVHRTRGLDSGEEHPREEQQGGRKN